MINIHASKQLILAKLTLVLMLVIFVCQFFAQNAVVSVQFSNDEHPLGTQINHHHSHGHQHGDKHLNYDSDVEFTSQDIVAQDITSHEHANHSHNVFHSSIYSMFTTNRLLSDDIEVLITQYQTLSYAPPIPPPTV
ncbi:hypothetical protein [Pseudoalteromonas denitrificans]|uniref:Uncharacterized protein n=1 Tax=Pseudoalteromonas denitrificans DSM 6059 TaxID=1123010 RepID=A0A1I1N2D4_9GAMM|nr:hypothetical protein [Pseudoalteromonas denitrificans]SFC91797.1 hypothetical protein SAMN02745724_02908 [Pseudoalteromonas denitrificans DSM 6059]